MADTALTSGQGYTGRRTYQSYAVRGTVSGKHDQRCKNQGYRGTVE